jgi:8-oxo-dGTP pyrophosphatase MutT (NUDIX family)
VRPRDAGTLVIVDPSGPKGPRILLGKRRADLRFAPGKVVFPGGRVDPSDRRLPLGGELCEAETAMLLDRMKGRPSAGRARALALAAVRETFEETGLVIGAPLRKGEGKDRAAPAWDAFIESGYAPRIAGLRLLARAVTPPGRPRRFDARFFVVSASEIAARLEPTEAELDHLEWATIAQARHLELHGMTRAVLDDLADWLDARGRLAANGEAYFYFQNRNRLCREIIQRPTFARLTT